MSMERDGNLTDRAIHCQTSSGVEQKLVNQWFVDVSEQELLSNKKQAILSGDSRPISGAAHLSISHWDNDSGYEPVFQHISHHLCGPEHTGVFTFAEKNILSLGDGNLKRKGEFNNHIQNNSLVGGLPMPQDPNYWNAGTSGVREGLIHEAESGFPISLGQSYNREEDNTDIMNTSCHMSDNGISVGPTSITGYEHATTTGPNFTTADANFNSVAQTFNKENGNFMLMGYPCNRADIGFLSMGLTFDKYDRNFLQMEHQYETKNGSVMSTGPGYNNVNDNLVVASAFDKKEQEHFTPVHTIYDIGASYFASGGHIHQKLGASVASRGITNSKENNLQQLGQGSENGEGGATSALGFQNRPEGSTYSGSLIHSSHLLSSPSSPERSEVLTEKGTTEHSADQTMTAAKKTTVNVDSVPKQKVEKAPKKNSPNNFPSNVKSLLSTGIFDGVPVKYVSWSREKSLRGIIKGTGYLCGCDNCKMNKNLNAFEFERHAGCKTKHPNNHIYFVNGKTIYSVVQDLKGIQQEMLFEAIQNVTGSPINLKNFHVWKASYQAASRELQRIFGKDEAAKPS